jgi:4-alpha-glucanotransferase
VSQAPNLNGSGVLGAAPKAGVCLHFTSLANEHGIGDIGDASLAFLDQLADMNLRVWQFLPIGPTAYGDSPYQSLSSFAGNEMLIGLDPLVRDGLLRAAELAPLAALPRDHVDCGQLIPLKQGLLSLAAQRFSARGARELQADYDAFLARHDAAWLHDYALYRRLKSFHGERPWPEWATGFVRRDPPTLAAFAAEHRDEIERVKVTQFLFDRQWRELRDKARNLGIRLFGDIPIYIALDSADAWANREMLLIDADGVPSRVAGVPPDYFSDDGQLWGNPLYDWEYHARTGYHWWIERIANAASRFDMLRVDHFRGFESYWSVPFGQPTARDGSWQPGPGDALFVALEAALGKLPIVAEDLGVITDEVDALRLRHGIPGMKVLQFDLDDPEFKLADIMQDCVCYTGTHDNDTTLGWFRGGNDDIRSAEQILLSQHNALRHTRGSEDTVVQDLIRLAMGSRARVAVAPMQDFLGLGSEARMNIPGTTRDNWRWRLQAGDMSAPFMATVREYVEQSARGG